jgi:membrane-anchored mycosin MYCP
VAVVPFAVGLVLTPTASAAAGGQQCDPAVLAGSEPLPDADVEPHLVHRRMGVSAAHDLATGRGVTVAVLDSGVADSEAYERVGGFTVPGAGGPLRSGHGTIVAGLVAGKHGMAPDAAVYDVRVHDVPVGGDPEDGRVVDPDGLAAGVRHVLDVVDERDIGVVAISVAMPTGSAALEAAIDDLVSRDVVVVAPAGDVGERPEGFEGTPGSDAEVFPADLAGVLAVSAVAPGRADVSEFVLPNADTDVAAPSAGGVSVNATGRRCRTDDQVRTAWAAAQVTARILATTEGAGSLSPEGGPLDVWTGAGVVQAYDALTRELRPSTEGSVDRSLAEVPFDAQAPPAPEQVDLFGPSRTLLLWGGLVAGAGLALVALLRPLLRRS